MRAVGSLVVAIVLLSSRGAATRTASEADHDAARPAPLAQPAEPVVTPVVTPLATATPRPTQAAAPIRIQTRSGKVVVLPAGCGSASGAYDLVVHFHGAPSRVVPMFERSGIDAVLVVVNLGQGSGPYEHAFAGKGALDDLLTGVDDVIATRCGDAPRHAARLALSSWSAGYGATYRILAHADEAARVDTVLLADGLHVGFRGGYRRVDELQIAPFERFADAAARSEKLMGITHSSIVPPHYASTTETADYLLSSHGVDPRKEHVRGPRKTMTEISRGDRGSLHVRGFAGTGPDDHCDQLYAMGDTLFPLLAARWQQR